MKDKYIKELIDIIEHPENSNQAWKDMIIENAKEIIKQAGI